MQPQGYFTCIDCGRRVSRRDRSGRSQVCLDCAIGRAEHHCRAEHVARLARVAAKEELRRLRWAGTRSEGTS